MEQSTMGSDNNMINPFLNPVKPNPSPLQPTLQEKGINTLLELKREFQAVCKVKVYVDDRKQEYWRVDSIIPIDYSKKKKEKDDKNKEKEQKKINFESVIEE